MTTFEKGILMELHEAILVFKEDLKIKKIAFNNHIACKEFTICYPVKMYVETFEADELSELLQKFKDKYKGYLFSEALDTFSNNTTFYPV